MGERQVDHGIILPLVGERRLSSWYRPATRGEREGKSRPVVLYSTFEVEDLPCGTVPPLVEKRTKIHLLVPFLHLWNNKYICPLTLSSNRGGSNKNRENPMVR